MATMSTQQLALFAMIALGPYHTLQTAVRNRIDPRTIPVLARTKMEIRSLEPSTGCQGARDLRVTIKGSGFVSPSSGLQVSLGGETTVEVRVVRPDAIEISVNISASASPGPRPVYVLQPGADRAVLQNGFTVSAGVDLTLDEPKPVIESTRLVLEVPVKNIGCATSESTLVSGVLRETGQEAADKVPSIAPGGTYLAHVVFPLVEGHAALDASVALTVDPGQQLAESNEENNQVAWRGQIPAATVPPAPVVEPRPVGPDPVPVDRGLGEGGTPIWPWVLGGGVVLGAGAMGLRQEVKRRKQKKAAAKPSWTVIEGTPEHRIERPSRSRPLTLSIRVVEGRTTHAIVRHTGEQLAVKAVRV